MFKARSRAAVLLGAYHGIAIFNLKSNDASMRKVDTTHGVVLGLRPPGCVLTSNSSSPLSFLRGLYFFRLFRRFIPPPIRLVHFKVKSFLAFSTSSGRELIFRRNFYRSGFYRVRPF